MDLKLIFQSILIYRGLFSVLGTLIDSQNPGSKSAEYIHCLSSNSPILISDPFNRNVFHDDKFIAMEWYQLLPTQDGFKETLLLQFFADTTNVILPQFSVFDFWGLKINNPGLNDSAMYKATLLHTGHQGMEWSAKIVVAIPPVLESEKLTVLTSESKDTNSVILSCGKLNSLGTPPVSLVWKTDAGTLLPAVYQDGYLHLNLTPEDAGSGKHLCELDLQSPAAKCILETDLPRFRQTVSQSNKSATADTTDLTVVFIAVGIVAAIFLIAVVVVFLMRRGCTKLQVYNAREQEKKRDHENGKDSTATLVKDEENLHERSLGYISNGFSYPDSFTVAKLSQENLSPIYKKVKPQVSPTKDMVYLNGDVPLPTSKFDKQIVGKDRQNQETGLKERRDMKDSQENLPKIVPRSITTLSANEQYFTGKSVNGEIRTGSAISHGTLV